MNQTWVVYKNQNHSTIPESTRIIIEDWEVQLQFGEWDRQRMEEVCQNIQEWKVCILWLRLNNNGKILKSIENIVFSDLQQIFLKTNRIESIEGIGKINFPKLKIIQFDDNFLTSIKDFRKSLCPMLRGIGLSNNYVRDAQSLVQLSNESQNIFYEFQVFRDSPMMNYSIGWISKIKINIHRIYIRAEQRIEESRVKSVLQKKTYFVQIFQQDY